MKIRSIGVQRLSLTVGFATLVYGLHEDGRTFDWGWPDALFAVAILAIWFAVGWLAIRIPAWIWDGFMTDRSRRSHPAAK